MAAVPKKKVSKQRRGKRKSHLALKSSQYTTCSNCKKPVRPHTVCPCCGFYKGKKILEITLKKKKRGKK